jgi:hypothetical protein
MPATAIWCKLAARHLRQSLLLALSVSADHGSRGSVRIARVSRVQLCLLRLCALGVMLVESVCEPLRNGSKQSKQRKQSKCVWQAPSHVSQPATYTPSVPVQRPGKSSHLYPPDYCL